MAANINNWILNEEGITEIFGSTVKLVLTGLVVLVVFGFVGAMAMSFLSNTEDTISDAFRGIEGERGTWGR